MDSLFKDVRYSIRMLVRNPGFSAVVLLSLALGIGANTTIFSLVHAVLLRPLPVEKPDELVAVYTSDFSGPAYGTSSYPDYLEFRDKTEGFSGLLASSPMPLSMTTGGQTERIFGEIVTGNYFSLLGIKAAAGRTFLEEEGKAGAHPVVVLSHGLWERRFGSNRDLVGQTINLNSHPFTVVGVAPKGFSGTRRILSVDLWVPMMMQQQLSSGRDRLSERSSRWLFLMGRLKPAFTVKQAQASFDVLATQLKESYGRAWIDVKQQGRKITLVPESENRVPPQMRGALLGFLGLLMCVVGLVLLIACANVANLLLARATGRTREIAIRLSLGAGRGRLIRQLLTESLLLSIVGGALGLLLALWATRLLMAFKPPIPLPVVLDLGLNPGVLGFTFLLSILTGLIFGLAPAYQSSRADLVPALKDESGTFTGGQRKSYLRNALVIVQIALSLLLLIGAGLFLRSLKNAHAIDTGFDPNNVLLMSFDLRLLGYSEARGKEFYRQALERVRARPEVVSASLAAAAPLASFGSRRWTTIEGYSARPGEDMEFHYNIVSPEYFETMKISLLRGRTFMAQDSAASPGVIVVNETLARRFWPGQDAMGKRISVSGPKGKFLEIVGIARDGKYNTLGEDPTPFFYLPSLQHYQPGMTLFVRTANDPKTVMSSLRNEIQALDRSLPITDVKTMMEHMGFSLLPARVAATLLGVFGFLALALASVGIYGVMSYSVNRRTHEIGIRIALGAQAADVLKLIVLQGMFLAASGIILGLLAAFGLTRFLSSLLYGVSATDPVTFIGTPLLLVAIALLASYVPARRGVRVDPIVALRYE